MCCCIREIGDWPGRARYGVTAVIGLDRLVIATYIFVIQCIHCLVRYLYCRLSKGINLKRKKKEKKIITITIVLLFSLALLHLHFHLHLHIDLPQYTYIRYHHDHIPTLHTSKPVPTQPLTINHNP